MASKKSLYLISWNVNGIRAALNKGFVDMLNKEQPDIICLQETKAEKEQVPVDFPEYQEYWHAASSKKGYSGTAIFTKIPVVQVYNGFPESFLTIQTPLSTIDGQGRNANDEGRVMTAEFDSFYLVNVYTPNAKDDLSRLSFRQLQWDPLFLAYLQYLEKTKPVIFCGDLNVAHTEIDLARPKQNVKTNGFTKEEREGFDNIIKAGFIDSFRHLYPTKTEAYTWWSFRAGARARNVGWRIDYVGLSSSLKKQLTDAAILSDVMGSDHCPVSIRLSP